jgi:chromosome segregation ATPase
MAQVKEEGKIMFQNSLQILQHDKGKLNNDLQNASKASDVLGRKIFVIKEELLQPQEENTSLEEQVTSSHVENDQLQNQVSAKLGTMQKLEKLVSSLEQEKINLNSEVGSLTKHTQNRLLQVNACEDVKEKTTGALVIDQVNL